MLLGQRGSSNWKFRRTTSGKEKHGFANACSERTPAGGFIMPGFCRGRGKIAGGGGWGVGAQVYAQISGYPAPRDPNYKAALQATVEDLMPVARLMAKKPSRRMALSPGYGINPGDNVLIVVSVRFDSRVLEAIRRAIVEAGAKVDIVRTHADMPRLQNQ